MYGAHSSTYTYSTAYKSQDDLGKLKAVVPPFMYHAMYVVTVASLKPQPPSHGATDVRLAYRVSGLRGDLAWALLRVRNNPPMHRKAVLA